MAEPSARHLLSGNPPHAVAVTARVLPRGLMSDTALRVCPRCTKREVRNHPRRIARTAGGRSFVTTITIRRCEACDWSPIPVAAIAEFEKTIATRVALFGPVTAETFRWMRRSLSDDAEEASRIAGVDLETIIDVEHGTTVVPLRVWMTLAKCVRDRFAQSRPEEEHHASVA